MVSVDMHTDFELGDVYGQVPAAQLTVGFEHARDAQRQRRQQITLRDQPGQDGEMRDTQGDFSVYAEGAQCVFHILVRKKGDVTSTWRAARNEVRVKALCEAGWL